MALGLRPAFVSMARFEGKVADSPTLLAKNHIKPSRKTLLSLQEPLTSHPFALGLSDFEF